MEANEVKVQIPIPESVPPQQPPAFISSNAAKPAPLETKPAPAPKPVGQPSNDPPEKIAKRKTTRTMLAKEILSTEESFVESLNVLMIDYQTPLLAAAKTPTPILGCNLYPAAGFKAILNCELPLPPIKDGFPNPIS